MGKVKPRTIKGKKEPTQLEKALKAWNAKQFSSLRKCAEAFAVPYSTLQGRVIGGRKSYSNAHKGRQLLSVPEEKSIVTWIEQLDRRGLPPRIEMVTDLAIKILASRGKEPKIGQHWISRFLNRHSHLCTKFSTQVQKQRVLAGYPSVVKACFSKLQPIVSSRNIQPQHTYNMDEKGFLMGMGSSVKVICIRGRKSPPLMQGM